MDETSLTLELRPLHDGAYTHLTLRGPVATVPQPKEVRRLLSILWWWSGAAIDVALCVDGTNSGSRWLEVWDEALLCAPVRHRRIRFVVNRSTLAAGSHDPER